MKASEEIKNMYDVVLELLETDPKYRDNDAMLVAKVWSIQIGGHDALRETSAFDFLCEYVLEDTFLVSHESVTRARRKIQENLKRLRGDKWEKRHRESESVVDVITNL
jgi:hypothetical protein